MDRDAPQRDEETCVEGGWVQKGMYDIGWSDDKKCRGCNKEEGTEKRRLYQCPSWREVRNQIPEEMGKRETSKEQRKWQRGITSHPLNGKNWTRSHVSVRRWEAKKHRSWCMPVEGSRDHVTTDGSLLRVSVRWGACGWSVVQLVHDDKMWPRRGMYSTLDADLEVQRTIMRAGLTAFLSPLKDGRSHLGACGQHRGIIDGLRIGEVKCIGLKAKDADVWILIWRRCTESIKKEHF